MSGEEEHIPSLYPALSPPDTHRRSKGISEESHFLKIRIYHNESNIGDNFSQLG